MKMNFAVFIYFFFVNVSFAYSDMKSTTSRGTKLPGSIACVCGSIEYCDQPLLDVCLLPIECTAFFYYGFLINTDMKVQNGYSKMGKDYVTKLAKVKPTYPFISFYYCQDWNKVLKPETDLKPHLDNIKCYFSDMNVAGLILDNLFSDCSIYLDNISQRLYTYMQSMKESMPNMTFGLKLEATDYMRNSEIIDFNIISNALDFLIISFREFNYCTKDLYNTGIVPLNNIRGNTLENFAQFITKDVVNNMPVVLMFEMEILMDDKSPDCYKVHDLRCSTGGAKDFCLDNSTTFYEKGQFAKCNGASIAAGYIDLDDTKAKCNCGHPFPAFNFLLNGYNGKEKLTCPTFDGLAPPA